MQSISRAQDPDVSTNPRNCAQILSEEHCYVCDAPHIRCAEGHAPSGETLGNGSYGTVQRCSFTTAQGQHVPDVAVKTAVGNDPTDLRAAEDSVTAEARAICKVRSRCKCNSGCRHVPLLLAVIPSPIDSCDPTNPARLARSLIFPVYRLCLYDRLQIAKAAHKAAGGVGAILPLHERLRILIHIVRALSCAQRARIAHCDVKPSNIMLDDAGAAVLIDWGLATPHGEYCQGAFGTSAYVPPEMLHPAGFVARATLDIWSIGVVCLEMILPRRPASGLHRDEVYELLQAGGLYAEELLRLAAAPEALNCERPWATIILQCLHYNAKRRASLQQLESFAVRELEALAPPPLQPLRHLPALPPAPPTAGTSGAAHKAGAPAECSHSDITDSTLAGSFLNGRSRADGAEAAPQPATAADLAASTLAVLRLASVNSSAAFDLLRANAESAVPSEATTPGSKTTALSRAAGQPVAAPAPPKPSAANSCSGSARLAQLLGARGASTPAPLDGVQPLVSSFELESFDRFTERVRTTTPSSQPASQEAGRTVPASGMATSAACPLSPSTTAWAKPQALCMPHNPEGHSLAQLPRQSAGSLCPAPVQPCAVCRVPEDGALPALLDHRHPFGLSPPDSCLPFAADPVITAAAPCMNAPDPGTQPCAAAGPGEPAEHSSVLHLHLPRVRTARDGGGGGTCADVLPEFDELVLASPSESASERSECADASGALCRRDRCSMSFSKFDAYTPASASAATAADAAAAALALPLRDRLSGVCEELPSHGREAAGTEPPQECACIMGSGTCGEVMLFPMDDDDLSVGSCCHRSLGSRRDPSPAAAASGLSPWFDADGPGSMQKVCLGELDSGNGGAFCREECQRSGLRERRRRTWGDVSLHAAQCSVHSDWADACVQLSMALEEESGFPADRCGSAITAEPYGPRR